MNKKNTNGVMLISYPDSLGKNLNELNITLDKYFRDIVRGVHILPFYPSSSDRGFSPLSHRKIEKNFGTEKDIIKISENFDLMSDLIVNHISKESKYFKDYLKNGDNSKYKNYFIKARDFSRRLKVAPKTKFFRFFWYAFGQITTVLRNLDLIFHKTGVNRLILKKIYRPRPGTPFVKYTRSDGKIRYICCTFSADQVDLNIKCIGVRKKFKKDIGYLANLGTKYIRLDAVGYIAKRRGTNNFLIPETINYIKTLAKHAHSRDIKIIPEIHFNYKTQIDLAKISTVDYVYDFSLPFLMLNALYFGSGKYLKEWIKIKPENSINTLDTHDGIGVIDVEGLIPEKEIIKTSELIYKNGGNAAIRASGNSSENVDVYQINSTYFSALKENEKAYLAARAIQLFLPGIPQIYYVGLLAGKNDEELLSKTKNGRDINRHYYELDEIEDEINRGVVKELFELCKIRNYNRTFKGDFRLKNTTNNTIEIEWNYNNDKLLLYVDLETYKTEVRENNKIIFKS